jgi:RimJ/RimL family protein N-acetyltransferase
VSTLDLQPTLAGERVRLRPLRTDDFDALYAVASDPEIWAQHPDRRRYERSHFEQTYFNGAMASGGALVVLERQSNRVIGATRYYDLNAVGRELAIGYTFIETRQWGTGVNAEMKRLMLDHAFPWAKVVWFHVGSKNRRSCRALEKIGARLSHTAPRAVNGVAHAHAYYQIAASEYLSVADTGK